MQSEIIKIGNIPAVIYGEKSDSVFLFVHGKCGRKEEAEDFARTVSPKGWQVVGVDLPCHGERKNETSGFDPWTAVPELKAAMQFIKQRWNKISLRANSIGAWFSMLSFAGEEIENCLFVSPILDMNRLIENMMLWADVSDDELRNKGEIKTDFGETLSWRYREFAKSNPAVAITANTQILYAEHDNLTSIETVKEFAEKYGCGYEVMADGEHWFHTPEQLDVLHEWENKFTYKAETVCPCKRKKCERHGDCAACRNHHSESGKKALPACDRLKAKSERRK